ncbi:MAG: hypothetical protein M1837_005470 [Sclerophora amabilis]|nr:MAG: hypothetical protein M1837_005470 [Sclerophora amabilis]
MDDVFIQSRLIDATEASKTGAFTTLPIRIHKRNDIANASSRRLLSDWGHYVGDGWEKRSLTSVSKLGNLNAFTYTEALPERLAVLTYLLDLGLVHDDASEAMGIEEAMAEHHDFEKSLDLNDDQKPKEGSRAMKLKKLAAQVLLEVIGIDRELGMNMLEMYQKEWLAIVEKPTAKDFETLEEYYEYRKCNFGMRAFWPMVEFGMAFKLSDHDRALVQDIFKPIEEALMLTNDYWSWDREYQDSQLNGNRLVNSIDVVRRTQSLSIEEARLVVKRMMVTCETEYVERKTEFYRKHVDVSLPLRRWIEAAGCVVSGSHYWATSCARHHAWRQDSSKSNKGEERTSDDSSGTAGSDKGSAESSTPPTSDTASTPVRSCDDLTALNSSTRSVANIEKPKHGTSRIIKDQGASQGARHSEDMKKLQAPEASWYKPANIAIASPCRYIKSLPSKGVRSSLIESLNLWLQVPDKSTKFIENIVSLLHDASLMLDDIEDNSALRRGKTAAHVIFGHAQVINSANFMFVQAVQEGRRLQNPAAVDSLLEDLECLYLGQSWDLYWKHNLVCPTESEYMNMVDNKTGGMFRMLLKLMQAESSLGSTFDFDRLGLLFGRFFQIRDDYMNLRSNEYSDQKGFCEDLDEGKFSYPIVYCLEHHPEFRDHIIGIFRQRSSVLNQSSAPLSRESKMHILGCLKTAGTFKAVLKGLNEMEADLEAEIGKLETTIGETNPILRLLLTTLSVRDVVDNEGG